MINPKCKIGNKVKAARRVAGLLVSGTLAGALAAGGAGTVCALGATWQENADYIFSYLTNELGYTEAAACGIMANIRCESTFNPHAWNAGGGSYGLCQWTGGRYGRLQSWCRSNGYDYSTIDGQLAYLEYELANFYPGVEAYLRSVDNTSEGAYDAGQYYCYHFEAPASRGSVSVYRGGLASGTFWESYRPAEWYQIDGIWHYVLRDGSYQTQWLTIDGKTFYMDEEGRRISGWRSIDANHYYFDSDGVMLTGWQKIDGKDYYFDMDGSLVTGLVHVADDWFPLDETGIVEAVSAMEDFAPVWLAAAEEADKAGQDFALAAAEEADKAGQDFALATAEEVDKVEEDTALALAGEDAAAEDASEAPARPEEGLALALAGEGAAGEGEVDFSSLLAAASNAGQAQENQSLFPLPATKGREDALARAKDAPEALSDSDAPDTLFSQDKGKDAAEEGDGVGYASGAEAMLAASMVLDPQVSLPESDFYSGLPLFTLPQMDAAPGSWQVD